MISILPYFEHNSNAWIVSTWVPAVIIIYKWKTNDIQKTKPKSIPVEDLTEMLV